MLLTRSNRVFPIFLKLDDGDTAKYCRAYLRDKAGVLVDTEDLPHIAGGIYLVEYTYAGAEHLLIIDYTVFTDEEYLLPDTSHNFPADIVVFDDSASSTDMELAIKLLRNAHEISTYGGGTLYIYDGNAKTDPVLETIELYDADGNRTTDDFVYMKRVTA